MPKLGFFGVIAAGRGFERLAMFGWWLFGGTGMKEAFQISVVGVADDFINI